MQREGRRVFGSEGIEKHRKKMKERDLSDKCSLIVREKKKTHQWVKNANKAGEKQSNGQV